MNILLTGASGFIGSTLQQRISADTNYSLTTVSRNATLILNATRTVQITDLTADTDWTSALEDIDVVIHAAARVHVMKEAASDPLTEFRKVNVEGTLNLARQATEAGVKRFIFISSIKVNGEGTELGHPYIEKSQPNLTDPYGISKYDAKKVNQRLLDIIGI